MSSSAQKLKQTPIKSKQTPIKSKQTPLKRIKPVSSEPSSSQPKASKSKNADKSQSKKRTVEEVFEQTQSRKLPKLDISETEDDPSDAENIINNSSILQSNEEDQEPILDHSLNLANELSQNIEPRRGNEPVTLASIDLKLESLMRAFIELKNSKRLKLTLKPVRTSEW